MKTKKQSPILFSTPMVQAILNGTKTMTRRVVTPQPEMMPQSFPVPVDEFIKQLKTQTKKGFKTLCSTGPCNGMVIPECKFGKVGDLIYVRETFFYADWQHKNCYAADMDAIDLKHFKGSFTPSIHMPKAACRIWLEITSIRIERLNSISESDAINEGIYKIEYKGNSFGFEGGNNTGYGTAKGAFNALWESINGKNSWDINPFVWVIEFKRVDKPC
jgi:hypothetical protein